MPRLVLLASVAVLAAASASAQTTPIKPEQVLGTWRCFASNGEVNTNHSVTYAAEGVAAEHMILTSDKQHFKAEAVGAIIWKIVDGDKLSQRWAAIHILYAEQDGKLFEREEAKQLVDKLVGIERTDSLSISDTGMLIGGAGSQGTSCVR